MLFDPAGSAYSTSLWVVLAIAGTIAVLFAFAITKIVQARRAKPQTGIEELRGEIGVVRRQLDPEGIVFVHGELWRARSTDGTDRDRASRFASRESATICRLAVTPARAPVPAA